MKKLVKILMTAVFTMMLAFSAVIPAKAAYNTQFLNTPAVKAVKTVKVKSVKLNKTSQKLLQTQTYTLKATVSPSNATNKAVTYKSSNTKVATVDAKGKVTAKAAGTATITVTTKDGSKKATCKITVTGVKGLSGKAGNAGRISIPRVGYSMPLYSEANSTKWQKVVDAKDSALFVENYFYSKKSMIADHAAQGLKVQKNCKKGDVMYITKNGKVTKYTMTTIYKNAVNNGYGIVVNGKYADQMKDGDLFMYCCNDSTGKSVTVTFWKKG